MMLILNYVTPRASRLCLAGQQHLHVTRAAGYPEHPHHVLQKFSGTAVTAARLGGTAATAAAPGGSLQWLHLLRHQPIQPITLPWPQSHSSERETTLARAAAFMVTSAAGHMTKNECPALSGSIWRPSFGGSW